MTMDTQAYPTPTLREHQARMRFEMATGIELECPECHEMKLTVGKRPFGKGVHNSCKECYDRLGEDWLEMRR